MTSRKKPDLPPAEWRAGYNLARLRAEKKFSVRGLAEATEQLRMSTPIGPNAISQIENFGRRMSISDAWTLSRALGVSPLEFFLPTSPMDGHEFARNDLDEHGPNVLPGRMIRHLYRLPDESNPKRWQELAKQAMESQITAVNDAVYLEQWRDTELARISAKLDQLLEHLNRAKNGND